MTNQLERNTSFVIHWLVIIGTFCSIPFLVIMTCFTKKWGLMAGVDFAIVNKEPLQKRGLDLDKLIEGLELMD